MITITHSCERCGVVMEEKYLGTEEGIEDLEYLLQGGIKDKKYFRFCKKCIERKRDIDAFFSSEVREKLFMSDLPLLFIESAIKGI